MAYMNDVKLLGNVTRQPELRHAKSGTAVCEFGMAMNRKYRSKDGEEGEEVCFVDITTWGRTAESVAQYVSKGDPVLVMGRLKLDTWEKDNQKRSKLTVTADNVQFLRGKREDGQAPATAPAAPQAALAGSTDPKDQLPF